MKDSNEFERKIYSSTPDQSIYLASGGSAGQGNSNKSPLIDEVLLDEEDYLEEEEYDEHEVSINLDDSPKKPQVKNKLVNQASFDRDDDTLSNASDSEFAS